MKIQNPQLISDTKIDLAKIGFQNKVMNPAVIIPRNLINPTNILFGLIFPIIILIPIPIHIPNQNRINGLKPPPIIKIKAFLSHVKNVIPIGLYLDGQFIALEAKPKLAGFKVDCLDLVCVV